MQTLGARWMIQDQKQGQRAVSYQNLDTGTVFDCGACEPGTSMESILDFILSEGDAGDLVFLNGTFYTQILGNNNQDNGRTYGYSSYQAQESRA